MNHSTSGRLGPHKRNPVEPPCGRPGPRRGHDKILLAKVLPTGLFARTLEPCPEPSRIPLGPYFFGESSKFQLCWETFLGGSRKSVPGTSQPGKLPNPTRRTDVARNSSKTAIPLLCRAAPAPDDRITDQSRVMLMCSCGHGTEAAE